MPTLAEFIARQGPQFLAREGAGLPADQRRALTAILRCRTPALGGHRCACTECGGEHFRYHSCNHRMCPTCGGCDTSEWLERQVNRLLPALKYLARYVFRTAMNGQRVLTEHADGRVSFDYIDSQTKQTRTCTLPADTFLGRFLQHALPAGTHRVRYFGWLHPSARKRRHIVQTLLAARIVLRPRAGPPPEWHRLCPHCDHFTLVVVEKLARPRAPP